MTAGDENGAVRILVCYPGGKTGDAFINCSDSLVLTVEKNSCILEYAESNGIKYKIKEKEADKTEEKEVDKTEEKTDIAKEGERM